MIYRFERNRETTMTNPSLNIDPALFQPEAIDPETAKIIDAVEQIVAAAPPINTRPAAELREERARGGGNFPKAPTSPRAETLVIPGPGGDLALRLLRPEGETKGAYLHLHGGGWTLGTADSQDPLLEAIADRAGLAVASVEYRLAPEHPYPAAPDDCEAAALWLVSNAAAEFGTSRLIIGGESAGAHLSAVTLLRLRDRHGLTPFSGANLLYGAYDLNGTPSVRGWGKRNLILNTDIIDWFVDNFCPPDRYGFAERRDPDISPLYADLRGLPPALFTVGTLDPLIDDSVFMAARWIACGGRARLDLYPGGIHGFNAFPGALSDGANARMLAFLNSV
jgi:acetyl esterase